VKFQNEINIPVLDIGTNDTIESVHSVNGITQYRRCVLDKKFQYFCRLPSFRQCEITTQNKQRLEIFSRNSHFEFCQTHSPSTLSRRVLSYFIGPSQIEKSCCTRSVSFFFFIYLYHRAGVRE